MPEAVAGASHWLFEKLIEGALGRGRGKGPEIPSPLRRSGIYGGIRDNPPHSNDSRQTCTGI
jgi:hypothetical protein